MFLWLQGQGRNFSRVKKRIVVVKYVGNWLQQQKRRPNRCRREWKKESGRKGREGVTLSVQPPPPPPPLFVLFLSLFCCCSVTVCVQHKWTALALSFSLPPPPPLFPPSSFFSFYFCFLRWFIVFVCVLFQVGSCGKYAHCVVPA